MLLCLFRFPVPFKSFVSKRETSGFLHGLKEHRKIYQLSVFHLVLSVSKGTKSFTTKSRVSVASEEAQAEIRHMMLFDLDPRCLSGDVNVNPPGNPPVPFKTGCSSQQQSC